MIYLLKKTENKKMLQVLFVSLRVIRLCRIEFRLLIYLLQYSITFMIGHCKCQETTGNPEDLESLFCLCWGLYLRAESNPKIKYLTCFLIGQF